MPPDALLDSPLDRKRRLQMIQTQIQARGIQDPRVLAAFRKVPRHLFVPSGVRQAAYQDRPQPIGFQQTVSQPYMVALMTRTAAVQPQDRVLEIGTGSGYQTAILAELAGWVYSLERIPQLARRAALLLQRLGYSNLSLQVGDGTLGCPQKAPFEVIVVTAGAPRLPEPLAQQLAPGGRLVIPLEEGDCQVLYRFEKTPEGLVGKRGEACVFVPLIGRHGWD